MATVSEARSASPLRALRHRNFRLYFIGQGVSILGTWIQHVALSWLFIASPAPPHFSASWRSSAKRRSSWSGRSRGPGSTGTIAGAC